MDVHSPEEQGAARRHPGVAWSLIAAFAVGLAVAAVLPFAPFVPATESGVTGALLCGLAVGWSLTGLVARRATDRRPDWAFGLALFLLIGGLLLILLGAPAHRVLDWVWPAALVGLALWTIVAVHKQRGQLPRWLLYPPAVLLVLAAIAGGAETVTEAADAQAYPAPGRMIDVAGHRMHLRCTGSGTPTVVFEAAGGEMSSNLGLITPSVARTTRICTYDRAGRGWSEPGSRTPSGLQIATDLHTLLQRGGVPGPYVLAGHSFGGLYVRIFAARYPADVAGMVLVDSTAARRTPEQAIDSGDVPHRGAALLSVAARFGLGRLVTTLGGDDLPAPYSAEVTVNGSRATNLEGVIDEYLDAGDPARRAAGLTTLGHKPLFVLTAREGNPTSWVAGQQRIAALSSNSVQRVVEGVDHQGLVGETAGAAETSRAIADVVTAVRTGRPLSAG